MSESSRASEPRRAADGSDPALVDVCIIGGGIAGVVAALRAQELGLSLQLVEARELLHSCSLEASRDDEAASATSTSALELVRSDESVSMTPETLAAWKQDLVQRGIPILEGAPVFAVEREKNGNYRCRLSEPAVGRERRLRSRAILIATGAPQGGGPAGNVRRVGELGDLARAIDRPALVVGQSEDAVAKVIEVSDAKARAGARTQVTWCARVDVDGADSGATGDPGPMGGLGDRLLAATLRNQNIRSLSRASSLSALDSDREGDWLALVVPHGETESASADRRVFEFERDCVFRFDAAGDSHGSRVGGSVSEIPSGWDLLSALSVRVDRRDDQSLMVIDVAGRLSHAGLYAAGAVRGEEYLLCAAFGDVRTHGTETRSRYERVRRSEAPAFAASEAVKSIDAIAHALGRGEKRVARDEDVAAPEFAERWSLVRLNLDGSPGARFELTNDVTEIGRTGRDIEEPGDSHMADHHASVVNEGGEIFVADSGQGSGVWLRTTSPEGVELEDEDQVWLGAQILVATKNEDTWMVVHYGQDGLARETYAVPEEGIFVGRDSGHVLDPTDGLLSRRHAQFRVEGGTLKVYDRGARNGTYVKINGAVPIDSGAEFRVSARGYRLLRTDPGAGQAAREGAASTARGGSVELEDPEHARSFPVSAGATILQGYIEARGRESEPIEWECQTGTCGLCVVEVVSGAELLIPTQAEPDESRIILQTLGARHADKEVRLACLAKVGGDVVIRALKSSS